MVIAKHEKAEMESVNILLDSERGVEGFGQIGKKQL
jgi:dUTPase